MYIVFIAWIYVAVMMAVAEATASNGTLLGALITFVLYGLLPVLLVMYILCAPARARAIKALEQANQAPPATADISALKPDAGGEAPADAVAPVRKEP